jgi:hypothetical protein
MNTKLKSTWVEALRSGQYPQTTGTLHDVVGYCCIGVLCKVAGLEESEDRKFKMLIHDEGFEDTYIYEGSELNQTQLEQFGLTANQQASLVTMNDDDYDDFKAIATWVEENL